MLRGSYDSHSLCNNFTLNTFMLFAHSSSRTLPPTVHPQPLLHVIHMFDFRRSTHVTVSMEQNQDQTTTSSMRTQKGVLGWMQQRLLKVPCLREGISSLSTASPSTHARAPAQTRLGRSEEHSTCLHSDRLRFQVSHVLNVLGLPTSL